MALAMIRILLQHHYPAVPAGAVGAGNLFVPATAGISISGR